METSNIQLSVFSLAKSNNGFFKSEKQAQFLIGKFKEYGGNVGYQTSGYHSCPIFVEWDEKGITKLYSHSVKTGKNKSLFLRVVEGSLNEIQIKELKSLRRNLNRLQKEYDSFLIAWEDGSYSKNPNYKEDPSTVSIYEKFQSQRLESINLLKDKIFNFC